MRVVGKKNRSEIELDPVRAYHRGLALDAMLKSARVPPPRGVTRAAHSQLMQIDFAHQLTQARQLNKQ